jgi:transposase
LLGEQAWTDVAVPKPYPKEFREDVVAVAQRREPEMTLQRIAADFGFIRRMRWPQLAEWLTTQSSSLSNWAMPELIEAAIRVAAFELATQTDQLLADRSTMVGTDWASYHS